MRSCRWGVAVDELSEAELDDIRAFIENEDGSYPKLADLPAWWDATDPDARAPDLPNHLARDVLIWSYSNWAFTKRWAWEGLNRLLVALQDRREPIPDALKDWACTVVARQHQGTLKVPAKPRNPRYAANDDRDVRIMRVYNVLRREGWTVEKAVGDIACTCDLPEDTVRSVLRKMRRMHPFKGATKTAA